MEEKSKGREYCEDTLVDGATTDEDDDDYVPESLASFVAEVNRALANAKLNFLLDDSEISCASSPSHNNQSLDTTSHSVVLTEDEDDIRLKQQLLASLRSSPLFPSPNGNIIDNPGSFTALSPNINVVAKKELFPVEVGHDEEDHALEEDIASFFNVEDVNKPKIPNIQTNKILRVEKEVRSVPNLKQIDKTNDERTSSTSSFWGNIKSKLSGTPVYTKTSSSSSTSLLSKTPSTDQIAPHLSDIHTSVKPVVKPVPTGNPSDVNGNADLVPGNFSHQKAHGSRHATILESNDISHGTTTNVSKNDDVPKHESESVLEAKMELGQMRLRDMNLSVLTKHDFPSKSASETEFPALYALRLEDERTLGHPADSVIDEIPHAAEFNKSDHEDSNFLLKKNLAQVEKQPPPLQVNIVPFLPTLAPSHKARKSLFASKSGVEGSTFAPPTQKVSPSTVSKQNISTKLTSSTASRRLVSTSSARVLPSSDSHDTKKTTNPAEAVAKARERIRQRQLLEKKKREEEHSDCSAPILTATRAMRQTKKFQLPNSGQAAILSYKPEMDVRIPSKVADEDKRRAQVAEKVRSISSANSKTKTQRVPLASWNTRPPAVPAGMKSERSKLTTPKPFHFHGKDPVHPSHEDNSSVGMMESMDDFMRKGLRNSTQNSTFDSRPKITTPKPFKFAKVLPLKNVTPAELVEEKKRTCTLAERLIDYDNHLRDSGPPLVVHREDGPTIPIPPKFTPIPTRERPKSTEEREIEIMQYFESHPFKAAPILTELSNSGRGLSGVPKVTKKKLTVPQPFRLSTETRAAHSKLQEPTSKDVAGGQQHNARSEESNNTLIAVSDSKQCKTISRTRPLADVKAGSKLTPIPPERLDPSRTNTSTTQKANTLRIPTTIEVKKSFSKGGARITPSPLGSSIKSTSSPTKPVPFKFSTSIRNRSTQLVDPDADELRKKFKARPLPISTFLSPSSIASPSRSSRVPSTISVNSGPKLATEGRREQREAAVLASRINTELVMREKASIRQHKQDEKHKEEMRKAALSSPLKLKAGSMHPFHFQSQARRNAEQKQLTDSFGREARERLRNYDVRATSLPSYDLSPTKPY